MHTAACYGRIILESGLLFTCCLHYIGVIIVNQRISSPEVILERCPRRSGLSRFWAIRLAL